MDQLAEVLETTMEGYTGKMLNGQTYLTISADRQVFAVVGIAKARDEHLVETGLLARIEGSRIVIEHDQNNKPLVDALVQAGVPRHQIILAYAGESSPAAV